MIKCKACKELELFGCHLCECNTKGVYSVLYKKGAFKAKRIAKLCMNCTFVCEKFVKKFCKDKFYFHYIDIGEAFEKAKDNKSKMKKYYCDIDGKIKENHISRCEILCFTGDETGRTYFRPFTCCERCKHKANKPKDMEKIAEEVTQWGKDQEEAK